jgi:hypothetical protein
VRPEVCASPAWVASRARDRCWHMAAGGSAIWRSAGFVGQPTRGVCP